VRHHPVGHREVGRGVVELDVAAEGRATRDDDRRGEDGEDPGSGRCRPPLRRAAPGRDEQEPGSSERDDERPGELRGRPGERGELPGQNYDRQADWEEERARKPLAGDRFDQPSAAKREAPEQERKREPGYEEGDYGTGATWPEAIRLRARFGDGS
jgi:hypothetical protein